MKYLDERLLIKRDFANYYLFLDNEFWIDENFGTKIYELNNENVNEILFSVRVPFLCDSNSENNEAMLNIPINYKSEKLFYEMNYENKYHLFQSDYLIKSISPDWEAFVSEQFEICIFGCSDTINDRFKTLFNPYKELSLEDKYKTIWNAHSRTEIKEVIAYLEYTFDFSRNNR